MEGVGAAGITHTFVILSEAKDLCILFVALECIGPSLRSG